MQLAVAGDLRGIHSALGEASTLIRPFSTFLSLKHRPLVPQPAAKR